MSGSPRDGVRTVVVVGNPRAGSRTRTAAEQAAHAVLDAAGLGGAGSFTVIDLAELAPHLLAYPTPEVVKEAKATTVGADVLVVASPTYKGTYTGLLKVFLDQIGGGELTGVAIPLLVMGSPAHTLAVETHLRPLLVELGAQVPSPGLALIEADLPDPADVLAEWAGRVGPAVRRLVAGGVPEEARP